jgi:radical SAM protein with 4Fe4S-binding SPASM domain
VHVRPTFGPSRAGRLDADVREIFDLGFRRLSLGFDLTASYGEDRLRALEGSIGRLVDWYAAELGRGRDIAIPSLDGIGTDREVPRRGLFCGAGDSLLAVDTDGTVFPCWRYAGERRRRIGDVFGGIDDEKRRPFVEFEAAAMPSCRGCRHARRCGRCAWVAERHSGGLDRMPPEACRVLGAVGDAGLRLAERLIAEHNPIFLSRLRDRALRARSSGDRVLVETPGGLVAALDREVLKRYRID